MSVTLLFKWKGSGLKSRRSTIEKELKEEGWGTSLTEEQLDKCEYLERKAAKEGIEKPFFPKQPRIGEVK